MSNQEVDSPEQQQPEAEAEQQAEPDAEQEDPDRITEEQAVYFEQILNNIDKMHGKLQRVKDNMVRGDDHKPVTEINQIAETLLQAKENSQIVGKEDLGTDITATLEENIVEIYSKNQLMKQKIEQLAKTIVEKNRKIAQIQNKYDRQVQKTQQLEREVEILRTRPEPPAKTEAASPKEQRPPKEKKPRPANNIQSDDYDFWNAEPTQNLKKKKDVTDSGLWVNQQQPDKGTFVTQPQKR